MKRFVLLLILCVLTVRVETTEVTHMQEVVQVDLVDLYFTATTQKGQFINDLKKEEITVIEDGVPQQVQRFGAFQGERNEIPILMALVIDNSASMDDAIGNERKLDVARDAGLLLIKELGPLDRAMLVQFSDSLITTELTANKNEIAEALHGMKPRWWQTALFDALNSSIKDLNQTAGRKILLLCSDGMDNMSKIKVEEIYDLVARTPELTLIVLGTISDKPILGMHGKVQSMPSIPMFHGPEVLQALADKTGGFAFFLKNGKDTEKVSELLRTFVRSQYYLAYRSSNEKLDGSWRKIQLNCKRKDVRLQYRGGYYAAS
jgi:VWFA-related protein